jgi:hypothetical protein
VKTWSNNDKYGRYTIEVHDRIVSVTLYGAMGLGLSRSYVDDVMDASHTLIGKPWGYYVYALDFDASTYDANNIICECYKYCLKNGCIVDTYTINSPVAKDQLNQMRRTLKIASPIEDRMFDTKEQAFRFIHQKLASTQPG